MTDTTRVTFIVDFLTQRRQGAELLFENALFYSNIYSRTKIKIGFFNISSAISAISASLREIIRDILKVNFQK